MQGKKQKKRPEFPVKQKQKLPPLLFNWFFHVSYCFVDTFSK
jgi:hypothetical protein